MTVCAWLVSVRSIDKRQMGHCSHVDRLPSVRSEVGFDDAPHAAQARAVCARVAPELLHVAGRVRVLLLWDL